MLMVKCAEHQMWREHLMWWSGLSFPNGTWELTLRQLWRAGPPVHSWLSRSDGIAWIWFRRHVCPLGSCPEPWAALPSSDPSSELQCWTRQCSRRRSRVCWGFFNERSGISLIILEFAQFTESWDTLILTKLLISYKRTWLDLRSVLFNNSQPGAGSDHASGFKGRTGFDLGSSCSLMYLQSF